ncbi:MAG: phosphoribosylformylglycinamidine synthase I [Candidatus Cloacimonetes bacterium]|nr:phosphoribosylformylglycinamidine synthase I [Candidatus Cloacimonadota bacterium]
MVYNIITFPGSNCDRDIKWVAELHGAECEFVWHKDFELKNPDVVVIPGGFSYGDYLRCGALANYSNIMSAIIKFADEGGLIIGICNGFQILTEANLLPGTLLKNKSMRFICQHHYIKVENNTTPFTCEYQKNEVIDIPIAHKDGFYFIDDKGLNDLIENRQIIFRYSDSSGNIFDDFNPNGSVLNIAGIVNKKGNILGMMPHPERAADDVLPSTKGRFVFESINKWIKERK